MYCNYLYELPERNHEKDGVDIYTAREIVGHLKHVHPEQQSTLFVVQYGGRTYSLIVNGSPQGERESIYFKWVDENDDTIGNSFRTLLSDSDMEEVCLLESLDSLAEIKNKSPYATPNRITDIFRKAWSWPGRMLRSISERDNHPPTTP